MPRSLPGKDVPGLNANVVVRLKEGWCSEYQTWRQRDLIDRRYVYIWADGIHVNVRLDDEENRRQCLLVVTGATADGQKELTMSPAAASSTCRHRGSKPLFFLKNPLRRTCSTAR